MSIFSENWHEIASENLETNSVVAHTGPMVKGRKVYRAPKLAPKYKMTTGQAGVTKNNKWEIKLWKDGEFLGTWPSLTMLKKDTGYEGKILQAMAANPNYKTREGSKYAGLKVEFTDVKKKKKCTT